MFRKLFPAENGGSNSSPKPSPGCFVDVVTGSDSPLLGKLRRYRELTLRRSLLGRGCIAAYYALISPLLLLTLRSCPSLRTPYRRVVYLIADRV